MPINHHPTIDPREPSDGDLETFRNLEEGDRVTFFEWPVEPLTVLQWEDDEELGECVRVEAAGDESLLYLVEGCLWHYADVDSDTGEANPFPVQNLTLVNVEDE